MGAGGISVNGGLLVFWFGLGFRVWDLGPGILGFGFEKFWAGEVLGTRVMWRFRPTGPKRVQVWSRSTLGGVEVGLYWERGTLSWTG